jgi:hypothetical protein
MATLTTTTVFDGWGRVISSDGSTGLSTFLKESPLQLSTTTNEGSTYSQADRVYLPFDTSVLGTGFTVTSGSLRVTAAYTGGDCRVYLLQSTQTSTSSLTDGDWHHVGASVLCDNSYVLTTNGTDTTFALNAAGKSAVTGTATCYCIDTGGFPPDYTTYYSTIYAPNAATTAYRPKLTVEYTVGSTSPFVSFRNI